MGPDRRWQQVGAEGRRPQQGGVCQADRGDIGLSHGLGGIAAVGRVANQRARRRSRESKSEWLGVVTATGAEVDRFRYADDRARAVGGTGGWRIEVTKVACGIEAIGTIVSLLGIFGGETADEGARGIRRIQAEKFPAAAELEVRVKPVGATWILDVQTGGEDDQELAGLDDFRRENPLAREFRIVAERPPAEVDGEIAAIFQLDPWDGIGIFRRGGDVLQPGGIRREEFADPDASVGEAGVDLIGPGAWRESVAGSGEIGDAVGCRPIDADGTRRRRRELEDVNGSGLGHDVGCGKSIEQQVAGIYAHHVFTECHFNLSETADGYAGLRKRAGNDRSCGVQDGVQPTGRRCRRVEGIRWLRQIGYSAVRCDGDENGSVRWLRKGKGVGAPGTGDASCRRAVDDHIIGGDSADRLAEVKSDLGQAGDAGRWSRNDGVERGRFNVRWPGWKRRSDSQNACERYQGTSGEASDGRKGHGFLASKLGSISPVDPTSFRSGRMVFHVHASLIRFTPTIVNSNDTVSAFTL